MKNWRSIISSTTPRSDSIVRIFAWLLVISVLGLSLFIAIDVFQRRAMISFQGDTRQIALYHIINRDQRTWHLPPGYLCVPENQLAALSPDVRQLPGSVDNSDCTTSVGRHGYVKISMLRGLEIRFDKPTNLMARISEPHEDTGRLVVTGTGALSSKSARCAELSATAPTIEIEGVASPFTLPSGVEIHSPIRTEIVLPFQGVIHVGASLGDDQAKILSSGKVAIFSESGNDLTPVKTVELFPGDVVGFRDSSGCAAKAAGFFRAKQSDNGYSLETIASTQHSGALAIVEREKTVPSGISASSESTIAIKLTALEVIFAHPWISLLGALVTSLLLLKELVELFRSFGKRPD